MLQKEIASPCRICYIAAAAMREELSANEDIVFAQQIDKVVQVRGGAVNKPRQLVSAGGVIFWHLLALVALNLWLLRLLGYISLPW